MEPFQSSSTIQNYEFSDDILHLRQRINNKLESLDSISSRVQDSIDNLSYRKFDMKFWNLFLSINLFFGLLITFIIFGYLISDEESSENRLANEAILIFLLTTSLTVCIPYYLYQLTEIEETDQHIPENERKC
ncbi:uncharacterized protein LOC111617884 isoform X1 [Centruroides sculpturatus]|uniref:uncharacterized protein LOC111617884 isoform X1 n=1 Tax=Centruroides sculpturatus TaxID=218467 RepID=UPI000C6CEC99|nr:uncharacterized protein LOC111617884 isoform X1 [Centruroides sculpturatus]